MALSLKRGLAITVLSIFAWPAAAETPTRVQVPAIRLTGNRMPFRINTPEVSMRGNRTPYRVDVESIRMTGNRGVEEE